MASIRRRLRGYDLLRLACVGVAALLALAFVGFLAGTLTGRLTASGAVVAISVVLIGGAGLLYAWRLETGS